MIKKLDSVVFKSFIVPLIFTFLISEFIFVMQFLWKYIDDLVGKGLEFSLVMQLLGLFSFKVLVLALPLAILLSSTMIMGGFGENNELVAANSSGISTIRTIRSLIIFVTFLSIGAYFFSNKVLPYTNLKFMTLLMDIRKHKPALDIKEGVFYKGMNGYTMKIGKKSPNNSTIYDIILYDHTSGYGNDNIIMAEKGEMTLSADQRFMIFELYNGKQYQDTQKRNKEYGKAYEQNAIEFKYFRKVFDLKEFKLNRSDGSLFKGYYEMLDSKQLRAERDTVMHEINGFKSAVNDYNRNYIVYSKPAIESAKAFIPEDTADTYREKRKTSATNQLDSIILHAGVGNDLIQSAIDNLSMISNYTEMQISNIESQKQFLQKLSVELNKKYMLSFICMIFLLIGCSMGSIVRKGGLGIPIIISTSFYMIFHVLNMIGDKLAYGEVVPAGVGAWLPTIILFPIAMWLTYVSNNDSNMFREGNFTRWLQIFQKKTSKT
ncbi:MAG: LptF/LptG family permease [Chitinophagales bacterium]|nr:LptF/LptG family permease [Chitinophagales bacterium]